MGGLVPVFIHRCIAEAVISTKIDDDATLEDGRGNQFACHGMRQGKEKNRTTLARFFDILFLKQQVTTGEEGGIDIRETLSCIGVGSEIGNFNQRVVCKKSDKLRSCIACGPDDSNV
ncbi:hypothetical protein SDC9_174800 [bioreactor metagenome]|uniref:Uncharacterized protein n=1 Tax=bioreactor metagenome TaxID=1076179 RepID=A0A645GN88_9ZZZZ